MEKTITVIERDRNGQINTPFNKHVIVDDDKHTQIDNILDQRKKAGSTMVLILLVDDSVARHWTKPADA